MKDSYIYVFNSLMYVDLQNKNTVIALVCLSFILFTSAYILTNRTPVLVKESINKKDVIDIAQLHNSLILSTVWLSLLLITLILVSYNIYNKLSFSNTINQATSTNWVPIVSGIGKYLHNKTKIYSGIALGLIGISYYVYGIVRTFSNITIVGYVSALAYYVYNLIY